MRKKIIFIDVDGPLAWGTWGDGRVTLDDSSKTFTIPYPWVQEDCQALEKICRETNASLVVSSDWKIHFSFLQLKRIFRYYGITAPILDIMKYTRWLYHAKRMEHSKKGVLECSHPSNT